MNDGRVEHESLGPSDAAAFVARELPSTAPDPEPARRIPFWRAMLLFWLLPKRYGPHLAVDSLSRALAAHVLALLAAVLIVVLAVLGESAGIETVSFERLRITLAEFVLESAISTAGTSWSWVSAIAVIGAIPVTQLLLLMLATALMPFCAGGDRASSVWLRSVKNVYWSTTGLWPAAIVMSAVWWYGESSQNTFVASSELAVLATIILLFGVLVVAFVRPFVVGAHRYVGPAAGPAFGPREPRCDDCGYTIIGLPLDANCPECGLPVGDSLPGGRRRPSRWHTHQLRPSGWLELVRLQWAVLRGVDVFRRLPVHEGMSAARHFWWGTLSLFALVSLVVLRVVLGVVDVRSQVYVAIGPTSLLLLVVPLVMQTVVTAAACLANQVRYGIRDYRISAIVCYFASPLMWPLVLIALSGFVAMTEPVRSMLVDHDVELELGVAVLEGPEIILAALAVAALLAIVFWWRRLGSAMRAVRFANV